MMVFQIYVNPVLAYAEKRGSENQKILFQSISVMQKEGGIIFGITEQDFFSFAKEPCHYCGKPPDRVRLDRINNKLGYMKFNLTSCCSLCNKLKHTLDQDIFLEHIFKISEHQHRKRKDE